MRLRTDHPQMTAAAKAGLSVASARRIDLDPRPPSTKKQRRTWRTRPDPLDGVWNEEILPLLVAAPGLRPITLFDEMERRHPDRIGPSFRRTLERRIAEWKALHGADRDVMFPQIQQPGRRGLSDFTDANGFGVIVGGQKLEHRLYHFALAFSGFEHAEVILGGESYAALASGLENALRLLGGVPLEHRSDSLSAAFHNLAMPDAEDLTRRFAALVAHYGMVPTRNNRGVAHENGAIESRHGHVKTRVAQALLLRGLPMFDDLEAYRAFISGVIGQHNRRHAAMIDAERAVLRPLPVAPAMTIRFKRSPPWKWPGAAPGLAPSRKGVSDSRCLARSSHSVPHAGEEPRVQIGGMAALGQHVLAALGHHTKGATRQHFHDLGALVTAHGNAEEQVVGVGQGHRVAIAHGRYARRDPALGQERADLFAISACHA